MVRAAVHSAQLAQLPAASGPAVPENASEAVTGWSPTQLEHYFLTPCRKSALHDCTYPPRESESQRTLESESSTFTDLLQGMAASIGIRLVKTVRKPF